MLAHPSSRPDDSDPDPERAALQLAETLLGSASVDYLRSEDGARGLRQQLEEGRELEDAVLGSVFPATRTNTEIAGEFFGYFAGVLLQSNQAAVTGALAPLYDPADLVQSVLGDVLPRLDQLEFTTSGEFLALLLQKLAWKRTDKYRRHNTAKRDINKNVAIDTDPAEGPALIVPEPHGCTPLTEMTLREDESLVVLALGSLPRQEQDLLRRCLQGLPMNEEFAAEIGIEPAALRKRLERARRMLNQAIERQGKRNSGG